VIPSDAVSIPAGWPLDRQGTITCLTCHTEIPADRRAPSLRDFDPETAAPIDFCAKCHHRPVAQTAGSMHWLAVGTAHVIPHQAAELDQRAILDTHTRQCISCHNLYAHEPYLLTVPIDGSALCFTCHDMN